MTEPLTNDAELLYRQVHPYLFKNGRPSSTAFTPNRNDKGLLSVALASLTTPEGAFDTYTRVHGKRSCGTWAITVHECADVSLKAYHSPIVTPPDPAHGHVDFNGLQSRAQVEKTGQLLSRKANERGCLHSPPEQPAGGEQATRS